MTNIKTVAQRNRRSIIALMLVLLAFLFFVDGLIAYQQRSVLLDQSTRHVRHELDLLGQLISEALTRGDYATVEIFLTRWGQGRDDVISANVELENGFVLAKYQTGANNVRLEKYSTRIDYGDNKNAFIKVSENKTHLYDVIFNMVLQLILTSFVLVLTLGFTIWRTLKKTAINPLEEEITRHEKTTKELRAHAVELIALNRELEAFSYSVSHDLRAPLRAIDGFSQALLDDYDDKLDDNGRDYLSRVRRGAVRMALLIDDLLKLSRVSRARVEHTQLNLGQMANNVMQQLQKRDPDRVVNLTIEKDLYINGDQRLMEIVIENLLSNAWKYTSNKSVADIYFGKRIGSDGTIFYISDNGVGFDMKFANKLFGAFQRLHGINEYEGTGIGLATVQRIINLHGGRIWADAVIDKGATFYFSLDSATRFNQENTQTFDKGQAITTN